MASSIRIEHIGRSDLGISFAREGHRRFPDHFEIAYNYGHAANLEKTRKRLDASGLP